MLNGERMVCTVSVIDDGLDAGGKGLCINIERDWGGSVAGGVKAAIRRESTSKSKLDSMFLIN